MRPFDQLMSRQTIVIAVAAAVAACALRAPTASGREVLWRIVTECIEPSAPGYCERCALPMAGACHVEPRCDRTTDVWARTRDFVAIRDIKMCGCPTSFVHGLAIPRSRVTGVEDPGRSGGIWSFAWEVARARIADDSVTALVVNALPFRGQDQLHVHIVRLRPDARARLAARTTSHIARLEDVWEAAQRLAESSGLAEYSVVVASGPGSGFVVLADGGDLEREFTEGRCR